MRVDKGRVVGAACVLAAVVAMAACRGDGAATAPAVDQDLARDLAHAGAAAASYTGVRDRTRFVSALETGLDRPGAQHALAPRGGTPAPSRRARTRVMSHALARHTATRIALATASASADESDADAEAPTPEPAAEPTPRSVDAEPAASGPSSEEGPAAAGTGTSAGSTGNGHHRGAGWGRVLGGVLGAVIRGATIGDDDHCERDEPRRGRSGGRWPVGGGIPGGDALPMPNGGTFPSPTYPRY